MTTDPSPVTCASHNVCRTSKGCNFQLLTIHNPHGRALQPHERALQQHGRALQPHGRALQSHGRALQSHRRALQSHGRALQSHGCALHLQGLFSIEVKVYKCSTISSFSLRIHIVHL